MLKFSQSMKKPAHSDLRDIRKKSLPFTLVEQFPGKPAERSPISRRRGGNHHDVETLYFVTFLPIRHLRRIKIALRASDPAQGALL
jgi:hypothetical protein